MMITRGYEAQQLEEDRPAQINVTSRGSSQPSWSEPPTWANPLFQLSVNFKLVFLELLDGGVTADDAIKIHLISNMEVFIDIIITIILYLTYIY